MFNLTVNKLDGGCMVEVLPGEPNEKGRIKQEKQKGETCLLVAMELIAKLQNSPYQINDKMRSYIASLDEISQRSDERTGGIKFLKKQMDFSQQKDKLVIQAKSILNQLMNNNANDKDGVNNALAELTKFFEAYANSGYKDFDGYIQDFQTQERININLKLLKQSRINPTEKFKEIVLEHAVFPSMPASLKDASLTNRSHFLDLMITDIWKNVLHLEYSSWTPDKSIGDLIELINNKGLQIVFGHIGLLFYDASKIKPMQQDSKQVIYGWKPGAYEKKYLTGHAIILVGAKAKGQEVVYFIDPLDESEVNSPRKIYVISYDRLCTSAIDSRGILKADIPKNDTVQSKFSLMIS